MKVTFKPGPVLLSGQLELSETGPGLQIGHVFVHYEGNFQTWPSFSKLGQVCKIGQLFVHYEGNFPNLAQFC